MNSKKQLKILVFVMSIIFLFVIQGYAVPLKSSKILPPPDHSWRAEYTSNMKALFKEESEEIDNNPRVFQDVDVKNYTLWLDFNIEEAMLDASVTITVDSLDKSLDEVVVDLYDDVLVNFIQINGQDFSAFERKDDKIYLYPGLDSTPIEPGTEFTITIDYTMDLPEGYGHGIVLRDNTYKSFLSDLDGNSIHSVCSAGQPYNSPGWWPSFDYPSEKATYDIHITCPDYLTAVSNGSLQGNAPVDNGDGTASSYWKESHPMYTSLFAIAISEYESWQDIYVSPLDGTEMPLYFYAFPVDAEKAKVDFSLYTKAALQIFSKLYGEYPFIDEKYGVLESPFMMGSLEHQTITHLTYRATQRDPNWSVIVHELGHQWWGDWVTCKTWQYIWLHEGFATYSEVLFNEYYTGGSPGQLLSESYDDGLYDGELSGTPFAEDLANPWDDDKAIYDKSGWVVHMLRNILGNDDFFAAVKQYGIDNAYGNTETDDLKAAMEEEYGQPMDEIFDEWIYTPYRPIYQYEYAVKKYFGKYIADVTIFQTQDHMIKNMAGDDVRDFYIMPIDITAILMNGDEKTITVYNDHRRQSYQFELDSEPESIEIDHSIKILCVKETPITDKGSNMLPSAKVWIFPRKTVSLNAPVKLFGIGRDSDGSVERYEWVIDNRQIVEGQFATVSFDSPGTHQVFLTVVDDMGDAGSSIPFIIDVE